MSDLINNNQETLKEKYRKIEMEFEEKKKLYRMIIHDLKSPLANIAVNAELIKSFGNLNEDQAECQNLIGNEIRNLESMVTYLLNIVNMEEISIDAEKVKVDIIALLKSRIEQFKHYAQEKNIELNAILVEEKLFVNAVPLHIMCIIDNLISNAIKYSNHNKVVEISGKSYEGVGKNKNPYVSITVKDEGIGIPKEMMKELFNPFFRVLGNIEEKGHGVGLSNVKHLVEQYHGTIEVESQEEKGASFVISLPLYVPTVLVIPSSSETMGHLKEILHDKYGYRLIYTETLQDTFKILDTTEVTLILVDITSSGFFETITEYLHEQKSIKKIPLKSFYADTVESENATIQNADITFSEAKELALWLEELLFYP
ncbi:MAG: GHKL domain-containing protein [Nitrospinae bacterium]|nr:GHKL domain-containing protein [Nitrospinota bacterium]